MEYKIEIYHNKEDLPFLEDKKFFHYSSAFDLYSNIPSYSPFMLVLFDGDKPIGCMFAIIIRINRFLYGSVFKRCYVSQQPSFFVEDVNQIEAFDLLIQALVKEVSHKVFLIEYRNINSGIYGYKGFRDNGFFSVKWINVANSLQKKRNVWNQLSATRKNQVNKAIRKGVYIEEVVLDSSLKEIYKLIHKSKNWKYYNRFPPYQYFENYLNHYINNNKGKILVARYKDKIIGGVILGYQEKKTLVLYYWGKESYKTYHPAVFALYSAMEKAEEEKYEFFDFMDSGYLNVKTGRPRYLLQLGGKSRATRRWYRFNWRLFNFFGQKIYD